VVFGVTIDFLLLNRYNGFRQICSAIASLPKKYKKHEKRKKMDKKSLLFLKM